MKYIDFQILNWNHFKSKGSLLSQDYMASIEKGILTSIFPEAKELLDLSMKGRYWTSYRNRTISQFVVWNEDNLISKSETPE